MKIVDIVKLMVEEQDPENVPSNVQIMMQRFKILKPVIDDLLGTDNTDIENIVSNIEVIVFKPTTFKVILKNGNEFMLKYNPSPVGVNGISKSNFKPKDFFQCQTAGKKFDLINRSQFQQAINNISGLLKTGPITKKPDDGGGETPEEQGNGQPNQQQQGNEEEPQ